jgi:hypothetical protein
VRAAEHGARSPYPLLVGFYLFVAVVTVVLVGSLAWWAIGVWKESTHQHVSSGVARRTLPRRNTPARSVGDWDAAYLEGLREQEDGQRDDG